MKVSKSIFVILLWKGQSQTFHVFLSQKGTLRQQKSVNLCDALIVLWEISNCNVMCQKFCSLVKIELPPTSKNNIAKKLPLFDYYVFVKVNVTTEYRVETYSSSATTLCSKVDWSVSKKVWSNLLTPMAMSFSTITSNAMSRCV